MESGRWTLLCSTLQSVGTVGESTVGAVARDDVQLLRDYGFGKLCIGGGHAPKISSICGNSRMVCQNRNAILLYRVIAVRGFVPPGPITSCANPKEVLRGTLGGSVVWVGSKDGWVSVSQGV